MYDCNSKSKITPSSELEDNGDDSLQKVIELVDEWMADESGYNQEVYPQIEAALTQNRQSESVKITSFRSPTSLRSRGSCCS